MDCWAGAKIGLSLDAGSNMAVPFGGRGQGSSSETTHCLGFHLQACGGMAVGQLLIRRKIWVAYLMCVQKPGRRTGFFGPNTRVEGVSEGV